MIKVRIAFTRDAAEAVAAEESQVGQGWLLAIWPFVIVWRRK